MKAISFLMAALVGLTAESENLIYDDFVSDNCGGVFCWYASPEDNVLSRRQLTVLPELAPGGKRVLRISVANSLRMDNKIRLVPGGRSEDGRPAGEVGSRHAFHFVGCDPFFVRDDVDLANIRALNRGNSLR